MGVFVVSSSRFDWLSSQIGSISCFNYCWFCGFCSFDSSVLFSSNFLLTVWGVALVGWCWEGWKGMKTPSATSS